MYKIIKTIWVVCIIGSLTLPGIAAPPPPDPAPAIENAILEAGEQRSETLLPAYLFDTQVDNMRLSSDGNWSTAWIQPVDPDTGQLIPAEPGLALAKNINGTWIAILPGDPAWAPLLESLPADVLSEEEKAEWLRMYGEQTLAVEAAATYGGYRLPWEAGRSLILTRSITHYTPPNPSGSMHNAFDFAAPWVAGSSPMFNVHASRAGTVKYARWTQPNGDESAPGNYLVLEDLSTIPPTYQLYLHLAQDSIPLDLRVPGTPVAQGQFLALADDTGYSSGNHLHFQVHTNPSSYWGTAVDITFDEVGINGGRPRTPTEAVSYPQYGSQGQWNYVSANTPSGDVTPPYGDFIGLEDGRKIESESITFQAWGADNESELASARFQAYYENEWHNIGLTYTSSSFAYTWNVCNAGIPDGPIELALELRDSSGNYSPPPTALRHILKDFTCPSQPPACTPGNGQVALYSLTDYAGSCILLNQGDYPSAASFGSLGDNTVASIQVGSGALATGFSSASYGGRSESFASDDPNLSDNRLGSDTLSSLRVVSSGTVPRVPAPTWPLSGEIFAANESLTPAWQDIGGGLEFQVKLDESDRNWTSNANDPLGSLGPGLHSWQVRARNAAGTSNWSSLQQIRVNAPESTSSANFTAPFVDTFEGSTTSAWSHSNTWDLTDLVNHTAGGSVSWGYDTNSVIGYDTGAPNHGDLTSPHINLPAAGYALTFFYRYETESPFRHWDQRWVQISANGGAFTNLYQFSEDPPNVWLSSPSIDLSAYAGKNIQIRFHFETLDEILNLYSGWMIDDVSIDLKTPLSCPGGDSDQGTPANALRITPGEVLSGAICPAGDQDFWVFSGTAGQRVGARTEAQDTGSSLDTYLYLLDSDGVSILAENDDIVQAVRTDSQINYVLPRSGDYYIKLRAWDNPSAGGDSYTYSLHTYTDSLDPIANIAIPPGYTFLPSASTQIQVDASDPSSLPTQSSSGLDHAEFWWHSGDWILDDWEYLGADWDPSDGIGFDFDTSSLPDQAGMGLYVKVFDKAGNWTPAAAWGLALDRTPPVSSLDPTATNQNSTVVSLQWSGSDNLSGIDHYDLQFSKDGGSWQNLNINIPAAVSQTWFTGEQGHSYSFRLRAVDRIGNQEAYPLSAEASSNIPANVCADPDAWEPDNGASEATAISTINVSQNHNFCNTAPGSSGLKDADWYRLNLAGGTRLWITAHPLSDTSAPTLELYASDGSSLLATYSPPTYNEEAHIYWPLQSSTTLYLKAGHLDPDAAGEDIGYRLQIQEANLLFMPLIFAD